MKSIFALICTLLYLFLFVNLNDARKDQGEYWKIIMKDQPIPEAIKGLFHGDPLYPADARKKDRFVKDFDATPNVIIYDSHMEPKAEKPHAKNFEQKQDMELKEEDSFLEHIKLKG